MSEIQFTRMEALRLKNKLKLAKKGHKVLKKKMDVLVMTLFEILKKLKGRQEEVLKGIEEAEKALKLASLQYTEAELLLYAKYNAIEYELEAEERNIMGVKIPKFKFTFKERPPYYPFLRSMKLDKVIKIYRSLLYSLIELAEIQVSLKVLLKDLKKTRRRVNALDYVIIPRIEEDIKKILQKLDEMERENFIKLKVLKDAAQRQNAR
ncbi:MAG: V-type ATP synthase subunit D [Candidatus Micrarchaeota archaeon]|nr:V-type ATP synthase subunit D [Candidatus Micrarchaeota archaeon]